MGNACGCGRARRPRIEESSRAIRSADAACADMGLRRRLGEHGRYIRRTSKWTFGVVDDHATDKRFRLEMLKAPIQDVPGGNWKWLQGDHFMPLRLFSMRHDYCCFLYETIGNVREYISERRLALGRDREQIVVTFLPAIFAGLKDLGYLNLHHTALSWDAIEIDSDKKARFGSLEYLVDGRRAARHDLADVRHLPPESLRACHTSRRAKTPEDVAKREVWIVGSLLLEIMLHKHVSGREFLLNRTRPGRRVALRNIRRNVPRLHCVLDTSTLSESMQRLLKQMLVIDFRSRMSLDQAINEYDSGDRRSVIVAVDEPKAQQVTSSKRPGGVKADDDASRAEDLVTSDEDRREEEPARTKKRFFGSSKKKKEEKAKKNVEVKDSTVTKPCRRPPSQQQPCHKKKEKEVIVKEPVKQETQERTCEQDANESSYSEDSSKGNLLSDCFGAKDEGEQDTDTAGETRVTSTECEEAKGLVAAARRYFKKSKEKDTNIVATNEGCPDSPNVVISIKFVSPDKKDTCETKTKTINLSQCQQKQIEEAPETRQKDEAICSESSTAATTDTEDATQDQDNRCRAMCMKPCSGSGKRKSSSAPPSISGVESSSSSSRSSSMVSSGILAEIKNIDAKSDLYEIPHSADVSSVYTTDYSVCRSVSDVSKSRSASSDTRTSMMTTTTTTSDRCSTASWQQKCSEKPQQSGNINDLKKPQCTANVRYDARYKVTTISSSSGGNCKK